jgi:hypothetical protein
MFLYLAVGGGVFQYCKVKQIAETDDNYAMVGTTGRQIWIAIFWFFTLPFIIGAYFFNKYFVKKETV